MKIEFEATFANINKNDIRNRLKKAGAVLARGEFMQKRVTFNFPTGHENENGWLRVRDEGDKITMIIKIIDGEKIENQKEIGLTVNDFSEAVELLETIGCRKKSYQETKRELWMLDEVEIMLDEWPFLEPLVEIEGKSEEAVKNVSEKLGFDYAQAFFGCVSPLYAKKYGVTEEFVNNHVAEIIFEGKNPFEK
ncbi:MAG: CYTH domain-containing protein [Parcubacteria group bacterium]|jgi:adenylate cyclase class 2